MMRRLLCAVLALALIVCLLPLNVIEANATSAMKASDEVVIYLKTMEGFTAIPRWDYVQWTVGYGNRCPDEHLERYLREGIPIEEADALFLEQLVYFEDQVNAFIKKNRLHLTQNQFDAVLSITYNCGAAWLTRESDLRTAILNGVTGNALIGIMSQWCTAGGEYLPGLMRRRLTEADMYLYGRYNTQIPSQYCYVFYDAGEGSASAVAQGYDCNLYAIPMVTPTRDGYTFLGWYTAKTGGVKVTYLDENLHQSTLYAHWAAGNGEYNGNITEVPDGVLVTVTGDVLNVRSGPGTSYAVVASVVAGEQIVITQVAVGEDGRLWGKIDKGWLCLQYTTYDEVIGDSGDDGEDDSNEKDTYPMPMYATIVGGMVNLYNGPDTGYPKVGTLQEGTEVLLVETYKMFSTWWARVETGGWICLNSNVLLHDDQMLLHSVDVTVTNSFLNVRSGPGTHYNLVTTLKKGDVVKILAVEEVNSVVWGRYSGGWISLEYTDFDASRLEEYKNHIYGDWYLTAEATCVSHGVEQRDCKYCDAIETRETEYGDHSYGQWQEFVAPTCTEDGMNRRYCAHCDAFEEAVAAATGHNMGQWQEVVVPTCTEDGLNRRYCANCDAFEESVVSATGHTMGQWYEVIAPTLEEAGQERRDCQHCDYSETREVEPVEHLFTDWYVAQEPTCTEDGVERRDCTDCDYHETRVIPALGHEYSDWYVAQEATCTEDGVERRDCANCDHHETKVISALGHDLSDWYVAQEPTCTENGLQCRDCANCDYRESVTLEKKGHDYCDWYISIEPTYEKPGQERRDCATCGAYETREKKFDGQVITKVFATITTAALNVRSGPGIGYSWVGSVSYGTVHEVFEQTTVGDKVWGRIEKGWICLTGYTTLKEVTEVVGHTHSFGDWYAVEEATCTTSGLERRDCANCSHYETRVVNATGHSYGEWYTVREATSSQNGLERRECQHCDHYEERETTYEVETVTKIYGTLTGNDYLNIRSGAGMGYALVGKLYRGDRVEIFEIVSVGDTQWGRIALGWICLTGYITLEYVEEPVEHTHSFGNWYTTTAATCTANGEQRRDCACGHYETKAIAATGHSYGDWYTVREATATENGLERRDCRNCDHSEERVTEYQGTTVKRVYATVICSVLNVRKGPGTGYALVGSITYGSVHEVFEQVAVSGKVWGRIELGWICLTSNTRLEEVEESTGHTHTMGDWYTITEATCTANGEQRRDCAGCDHYETETIAAIGHSYGNWYTVKEATISENGLERRNCQHCDHYQERETEYEGTTVTKVFATITVSSLNVRSGPGTGYGWVGYVTYGTVHEVFEQKTVSGKIWGRIEQGWICLTGYTTLEEVVEPANKEDSSSKMTVTATVLNVRAGAGTGYNVVTSLAFGTKVTVLETKVVNGVTWARIEQGWVSMAYLG